MTFLEIALDCIQRGWYVFPCKPKSKRPQLFGGFHNASNDEAQIRAWWTEFPNANVAIAQGKSGLVVFDCDCGNVTEADFHKWAAEKGLPRTFTVRTGRRVSKDTGAPEFGTQMYYSIDTPRSTNPWVDGAHGGEVRCATGHVMAPGSIHPVSGELYEVLADAPIVPVPDYVRRMPSYKLPLKAGPMEKIPEGGGRHAQLTSVAGKLRVSGLDADAIHAALIPINESICADPVSDADLEHIAESVARYDVPAPDPVVVFGGKKPEAPKEPVDWRTRYMTEEDYLNVKPPEFLIDGFLVKDSIAMLGGPVAQRKSIIALNIAHALCTGDPLFGYFNVAEKPTRTVYLCPEMGAASFVKRIKQIGLGGYVGKTLFIQTMSEQSTVLDELDGELPGAVVIVDTITRFIEGDENKSEDMRRFAQKVFRLAKVGATVVLLHHSKKGSTGSLDDGLRGSSELAAFVDSCWVTELDDTTKPYESLSKMRNVKQRDFESDPFRLKPTPGSYYLTMDGDPAPEAVIKDRKEVAAREALAAILKESPQMGINKAREVLKKKGHRKGQRWVTMARCEILSTRATLSSA
jgi:hypothetical protein